MLVVVEVHEPRPGDRGKARGDSVVGWTLELDGADEVAAGPGGQPALDQAEETGRIAGDVGEQPVGGKGLQREGAGAARLDIGERGDGGGERRLVDRDDAGAEPGQDPAPAARTGAEIDADLARQRAAAEPGQRLPQLEIGAVRRAGAVLDKADLAVGKRARTARRGEQRAGVEQGPRAERRRRRRLAEHQRPGRHMR